VLSSGVAGGKPGFVGIVCLKPGIVGIVCVAPPIPFVGAIVMELAAMTHVPDNINPTTVKPMEVSFIWYFLIVSTTRANVLQRNWVPRQSVAAYEYGRSPGTARTAASNANRSSADGGTSEGDAEPLKNMAGRELGTRAPSSRGYGSDWACTLRAYIESLPSPRRSLVARACSLVGVLVVLRMPKNSNSGSCIFVIDNDASLRAILKELFESVGLHVELFASGRSFLENRNPNTTSSCLVLDVRLPGMSGLKVQEELAKAKISTPIIFLTGHGDIPIAVRAMKAGAVEFLTKPFREQDLLDAVSTALKQDRARRAKEQSNSILRESFKSLSARERDVVARVAAGELNKQIAADLGLSEVTVKVHRAKACESWAQSRCRSW
jgi:FixJ family two-component response regulator